MNSSNPLAADLDSVIRQTAPLWGNLRKQRIFITGGTGFFGCWLLESFAWANAALNLNAEAVVLTRDKTRFATKCPHLYQNSAISFYEGDIRNFNFPEGNFSHVIHAATDASVELNLNQPLVMLDTIIQGTRRILDFSKQCGAKRFLLTSSGAVYGKQPSNITHLSEEYPCQPNITDAKSAYAVGKFTAEHMTCQYGIKYGFDVKIARCFAFIGPHLPIDTHYAIGNFLRDGLSQHTIVINGDGTPHRSYLYAADLAVWLWTILFKGQALRPYNVGSDQDYSISELAHIVANHFDPKPNITLMKTPAANRLPERYVPDITRVRNELGLAPCVQLNEAIDLTKRWHLLQRNDRDMVA